MSTVGQCPRALAARKLGYDPIPRTGEDEAKLAHYSRMEAIAAQQIKDLGFELVEGGFCPFCNRNGIHIELDTPLFLLLGHLDRRLILDGRKLPVEIKSAGKSTWLNFKKEHFSAFPGYAGQECVYLEVEKQPGIYWVMDRDSGDSQKYIVNDFNNEINLKGFEKITLPITFSEIEDKLNTIEALGSDGVLPDGVESGDCYWCRYRFLCIKEDATPSKVEMIPSLIAAAKDYKYGAELEKAAEEIKRVAVDTLLQHSKQNKVDKYHVEGLSVSYRGQKSKEYVDHTMLKGTYPDIYKSCLKPGKPYDDYSIRVLGSKSGKEKKED